MAIALSRFETEETEAPRAIPPFLRLIQEAPKDDRILHPRLYPDRNHPIYGDEAMAARKAAKAAGRARNREIARKHEIRALEKSAIMQGIMAKVGGFVTCQFVDGRTVEGSFTEILEGTNKIPVSARREPASIKQPSFRIESPDHDNPQDLRLMDLSSVETIAPDSLPFRWQGDDS
jgi:hypothetical protein